MADSPKVPLTNLPGRTNWVERFNALGGKDNWIRRVAEHLKGKGEPEGIAIPTAVNAAQKACESGDLNFPGFQQINPGGRAEACAAYKTWTLAKQKAHAAKATDMTAQRACEQFRQIDLARAYLADREGWLGRPLPRGATAAFLDLAVALPGGRFPIRDHADVKNAIHAVGRARPATEAQRALVRRHVIARAKAVGATHLIPASWNADGSLK